jgi:hypothetical protein
MNGLPNYWGDVSDGQEDSLLDPNMQMAVWIPLYSPHASPAPALLQRASTVPTPVCDEVGSMEREVLIYDTVFRRPNHKPIRSLYRHQCACVGLALADHSEAIV